MSQDDLESAQIVVLANATSQEKVRMASLCRDTGVKLLTVDSHGMVQCILVDVAEHTYKKTETVRRKGEEAEKIESIETMKTPKLTDIFAGGWDASCTRAGRKYSTIAGVSCLAIDAAELDGTLPPMPPLAAGHPE